MFKILDLVFPFYRYLNYSLEIISLLHNHGVKPVMVFDRHKLEAKHSVHESRSRLRTLNVQKGKQLWESGNRAEAVKHFQQGVKTTWQMAHELIKVLRAKEIDYVVAPFEADSELAFLMKNKYIDALVTEDSDLLAFGCSKVLFKLDLRGNCKLIKKEDLNKCLSLENYKFEYFRQMCILSGCDYLDSIPGIGIKRALTFIKLVAHSKMEILEAIPLIGNMIRVKSGTG